MELENENENENENEKQYEIKTIQKTENEQKGMGERGKWKKWSD